MNCLDAARSAPRCSAHSKRTGKRCKAPAVRGWSVCRFHGAGGGGPKGRVNGNWRGGAFTAEAVAERKAARQLLKSCNNLLDEFR